jgi:hypothetical protein
MSWRKALLAWVLIALAETVHGVLRELYLTPLLGDPTARRLGVWIGCGIIFVISVASVRWIGAATRVAQLKVGAAWVALMLAFEIGLGFTLGVDPERLFADYDPAAGGLMGFGVLFLLFAPLLADRARRVDGRGVAVRRAAALTLAFSLMTAFVFVWLVYQRDLGAAKARVAEGSEMVDTACGPIEYASRGQGPALLIVHGAGGGFDQALDALAPLTRAGFRAISMSRFGYLRTPLPADASAAAQADAHACLLDALGIPTAAILGASAGAPSATLFAQRHPERVTALVLLVPALYAPRDPGDAAVSVPAGTPFLFGTYEIARYTAAQLPDARFVGYETGGHLWVGHHEEVMGEITAFLDDHVHRESAGDIP